MFENCFFWSYNVNNYSHNHFKDVIFMNKIITISREFGSGGRTIGKLVAEQLGVSYYDKELVKQVALETGFDERYIEQQGEYAPSRSPFGFAFAARGGGGGASGMSIGDFLWIAQAKVIQELSEKAPCVIVGRCADYILKERRDVLRCYIHADMDFRAERIVRLYGESEEKPHKRLEDKDKKRRVYCKHYTGSDWGDAQNYHVTLDSGRIGIDKCVQIITDLARFAPPSDLQGKKA